MNSVLDIASRSPQMFAKRVIGEREGALRRIKHPGPILILLLQMVVKILVVCSTICFLPYALFCVIPTIVDYG